MTEPSHQRLSTANMEAFLEALAATGKVTIAAARIGVSTNTAHKWRNRSALKREPGKYLMEDPLGDEPPVWFHDAWDQAVRASCSVVEAAMVELATGYMEPVIHKGRLAYETDPTKDPICVDPIEGTMVYPLKLDGDGNPIPLRVRRLNVQAQHNFLKARDPAYREKLDVDMTTAGKPIAVPQRPGTVEDFLAIFGRRAEPEAEG